MAFLRSTGPIRGFIQRAGERYRQTRPRSPARIKVPDHLLSRAGVWRVVRSRVATLAEIREKWDLGDVYTAVEWLDIADDLEYLASKKG